MKMLLVYFCFLFSLPSVAQHSLLVGLYSDHYGYKSYKDYNGQGQDYKKMHRLNQGGPEASRLVGYMYSAPGYALGACTFKNSFYEQTHCLIGVLRYRYNNYVSFETGLNLTYGYRPALIMQMSSLSKGKKVLPIPITGVKFNYGRSTISYNYMAPGITAIVFGWKL